MSKDVEATRKVVEQFAAVRNTRNLSTLDAVVDSGYVQHHAGALQGLAGLKRYFASQFENMPDLSKPWWKTRCAKKIERWRGSPCTSLETGKRCEGRLSTYGIFPKVSSPNTGPATRSSPNPKRCPNANVKKPLLVSRESYRNQHRQPNTSFQIVAKGNRTSDESITRCNDHNCQRNPRVHPSGGARERCGDPWQQPARTLHRPERRDVRRLPRHSIVRELISSKPGMPGIRAPALPRLLMFPKDELAVRFFKTGIDATGHYARPPMPAFRLQDNDARDVTAYLRSLRWRATSSHESVAPLEQQDQSPRAKIAAQPFGRKFAKEPTQMQISVRQDDCQARKNPWAKL